MSDKRGLTPICEIYQTFSYSVVHCEHLYRWHILSIEIPREFIYEQNHLHYWHYLHYLLGRLLFQLQTDVSALQVQPYLNLPVEPAANRSISITPSTAICGDLQVIVQAEDEITT